MSTLPRLPKTGTDGQEICDKHGNIWVYDAITKSWISKGAISAPPIVTEDSDGIITTDIYSKIRKLEEYKLSGINPTPFKLYPGTNAYWYYFRSSDKLFKFRPEGPDTLRIEVDRGRIYQLLYKERCVGAIGPEGPVGDRGPVGANSFYEWCYQPTISGKKLDFAIVTPTPLTLNSGIVLPNDHVPDISVRIYKILEGEWLSQPQLELLSLTATDQSIRSKITLIKSMLVDKELGIKKQNVCNIPLSPVFGIVTAEEPSMSVEIDPTNPNNIRINNYSDLKINTKATIQSIHFDPNTNIVCGSIYLDEDWSDDQWCVRSAQRGPDGEQGDKGEDAVEISDCDVDDTNILTTAPIVNVRPDCVSNSIYTYATNELVKEFCVDTIQLPSGSVDLTNQSVFKSTFVAVQVTLEECKKINRYNVTLEDDEIDDLELIHWEPQPGCFTKRHFDRHKFDWIPLTDIPACEIKWFSPDAARPGKYPHELNVAPEPAVDNCCQDDFFYCPNVQEAAC